MDILNFRVAPSGDSLEFWIRVPDNEENYGNVNIEKIAIQDHKNYTVGFPEFPQVLLATEKGFEGVGLDPEIVTHYQVRKEMIGEKGIIKPSETKEVVRRLYFSNITGSVLETIPMGLDDTGMFFIYIQTDADSIPAEEVACCCHKSLTIACATNLYPIYNLQLKLIDNWTDDCVNTKDLLADLFMKKLMLQEAIELSDYDNTIKIFDTIVFRDMVRGDCLNACSHQHWYKNSVFSRPKITPFGGFSQQCGSC